MTTCRSEVITVDRTFEEAIEEITEVFEKMVKYLEEMFNPIAESMEDLNEVLKEIFIKKQKFPKIVKCLGCKPKTKIFKNFKDHRNCKKYWR